MKFLQSVICVVLTASPIAADPGTSKTPKSPIAAQDWMHPMCCPDRDCRIAEIGEVSQTEEGFRILGVTSAVQFDDARLHASRDNNIHVCSVEVPAVEVTSDGDWIELKCLYVPLGS